MADLEISQFTNGNVPTDTSYAGGYKDANTPGGNRRWSFANIATYISTKLALGTIVTQDSDAVAITGGTVAGVAITTATITTPDIIGVTDASEADAGSVGEYIEGTVASGSAVAMVNGQSKEFTSVTLTAGDWDIDAVGVLVDSTGGITASSVFIGTATGNNTTGRDLAKNTGFITLGSSLNGSYSTNIHYRVNISSTITYYLKGTVDSVGVSAYGTIAARRRR